jgi:hypothetical protein
MKRRLHPKRTNLKRKRVRFTTLVERLGPHNIDPKADLKALYCEHKGMLISRRAIEGLKAGIADADVGRVHTHEEVMARIEEKFGWLKNPK